MVKCLFNRTTKMFESAKRYDDLTHDSGTHVQIELGSFPNKRSDRWNDSTGIRAATAQELTDYDNEIAENEAINEFDNIKAMKSLAAETLIEINALRTAASLPTITGADWRQRLIDRYKSF